ncbi:MAG: membrane or secreted protein [Ignavibacteria bacterium]|nr:membrane or secreted protein [Ignavibacteria bacterium]
MKTLQKIVLMIALVSLLSSCQSTPDTKQVLSNNETRKQIIDTIASNSEMMKEMTEAMMNSKNGKMMMQGNEKLTMMMMENYGTMMKILKNNPEMMQRMMSDMMETSKGDTSMMSGIYKTMIGNHQMMDMIQKRMEGNKDMNRMGNMNSMEGMDKKTKK